MIQVFTRFGNIETFDLPGLDFSVSEPSATYSAPGILRIYQGPLLRRLTIAVFPASEWVEVRRSGGDEGWVRADKAAADLDAAQEAHAATICDLDVIRAQRDLRRDQVADLRQALSALATQFADQHIHECGYCRDIILTYRLPRVEALLDDTDPNPAPTLMSVPTYDWLGGGVVSEPEAATPGLLPSEDSQRELAEAEAQARERASFIAADDDIDEAGDCACCDDDCDCMDEDDDEAADPDAQAKVIPGIFESAADLSRFIANLPTLGPILPSVSAPSSNVGGFTWLRSPRLS